MSGVLRTRPMQLLFTGNFVSMLGSGMNAAALNWYLLQKTHSPLSLGALVLLQTLPMLVVAPLAGVLADRLDRRYLVMAMDLLRALTIACTAALCVTHHETLGELYTMSVLVSAATSVFWPTMTALTQELVDPDQYAAANGVLMGGVQGGFLLAGALVGFVYNSVGLGGVLFADAASYLLSFACYSGVRRGRHLVRGSQQHPGSVPASFVSDLQSGFQYLRGELYVVFLCTSSAVIFAAVFAQNVVLAPFADTVLRGGAVGFGWLNAAWAIGALVSGALAPAVLRRFGIKTSVATALVVVAAGCLFAPSVGTLGRVLVLFVALGFARGASVIGVNTALMQSVPLHYMGRVQNAFAVLSRVLQIVLGLALAFVSSSISIAFGFCCLALAYVAASAFTAFAGNPQHERRSTASEPAAAETL